MDIELVGAIVLIQERATEVIKGWLAPLTDRIKDARVKKSTTVLVSALVGMGLSVVTGVDVLEAAGFVVDTPLVGEFVTGLLGAGGSGVLHHIIDWIRNKSPRS